jgi:hypothetical protein
MALHRENILQLIGSKRYHSAILTTFSFDFYFFEMKAMKWLRSCGVRNVNVLIDGHYYAELMKHSGGEEMQLTPGYSLYPVFQNSIFHPKIWMLFGEKEGLLIIGSGNLTNTGNGNNEEIWGAFHFDIRSTENSPIFSEAWHYLQQLCKETKGTIREKTSRWIEDHAKWLKSLPHFDSLKLHSVNGKEKAAFLSNKKGSSIWQQLTEILRHEKVTEIITLSPYYDINGRAIQEIKSLFPTANIKIVLDASGTIPEQLPLSKSYSFYDWYELGISKSLYSKAEGHYSDSKLHAKIIHFKTKSDKEYCLFGSANVTPEGLGLAGTFPNSEVSLLIQSNAGSLLSQLGIKLKSPQKLSDFNADSKQPIYDTIIKHNRVKIRLLSAERFHDELHLFGEGLYDNAIDVRFFNQENKVLQTVDIGEFKPEMRVKLFTSSEGTHYVELYDQKQQISLSNKILLSDYSLLIRTHPNPKTSDFEEIYSQLQGGELTKVLDLLPYAILDDVESDSITALLSRGNSRKEELQEKGGPDKLYDLSSYKIIESNTIEKGLLLSSLSLRVLDVLKFIKTKEFAASTETELRVDEQEADLAAISGVEKTAVPITTENSLVNLKSEKRKLLKYFEDLFNHQQSILYFNNNSKEYRPTLTDLTRYIIALELMFTFGGRSEKYTEKKKEYFFSYLDFNGDEPYYNDCVKGCSLNIIGDFLMLARYGFKNYDFDYTRQKMNQLRLEALSSTLVCLLNVKWREIEDHYFKTLLLNALHHLGEKTILGFDALWPELQRSITDKISSLKFPSSSVHENRIWFENKILPAFRKAIRKLDDKNFDTTAGRGQLIYKSPWGYCYVKDVSRNNDFTLIRPGFMWDNEIGDFIMHSNDEVYRPLRLPYFIQVEI